MVVLLENHQLPFGLWAYFFVSFNFFFLFLRYRPLPEWRLLCG